MGTIADVAVFGGGVIGLTTAYFLARDGARVRLVERGGMGQEASWAGAGILPPGNSACAKSPFEVLRARSVEMFPALSEELKSRIGIDNGFLRTGGLQLTGEAIEAVYDEWRGDGVVVQPLDAIELQRKEPALAEGIGSALYLPDMGQVRNPWHLRALEAGCRSLGVELTCGQPIERLVLERGRVVAAATAAGSISADLFVVAAGAWTDQLLAEVGVRLGVHPVRGQIVLLHPEKRILHHILVSGARYLVPRGDGRILIGSTEEEAGFEKQNTALGVQGLLELATALVPALETAPVEKCWAGLRPGSKSGLPTIGPVPGIDNLWVAAGHFRAGIQLSPGTALMLTEMILHKPATIPQQPFGVS